MKKIRIRGGGDWKSSFQTICLAVSINSPKCSGENFLAALNFAQKTEKDFFVDLSDTLHAPNIEAFGADHKDALVFSSLMGNRWIRDLGQNLLGVQIIRWSEWHKHPDYSDVLSRFSHLYEKNETFRRIVNQDIERFTARTETRQVPEFIEASKNYILDECAGKTLQGRTFPRLAILYPGHELTSLSAVRDGLVVDAPKGLENTCHLRYTIESRSFSSACEFSQDIKMPQGKYQLFG